MRVVAHLKTGKCPKGASEKSRGRSRRKLCVTRTSLSGKRK